MGRHIARQPVQSAAVEDFDAWVRYLFGRPAGFDAADWDEQHAEWLQAFARRDNRTAQAQRTGHLFGNAGALLGFYPDDQVAQGLIEIVDSGGLGELGAKEVAVPVRTRGLRAIVTLFAEVFAPRITVEDEQHRPKLQYVCFMFFDIAALDLGDDTVLDVLEDILALPSVPCQRSALHGLGHAHFKAPHHVEAIVGRWLTRHRQAPQELRDYAAAARAGNVM